MVVDLEAQACGAGGKGGTSHGRDFVAAAGAVRGVANHWQMRKFFDDGDGGDVEGVARVGFERADAALAEDDVVIAAGKDVFGAEKKLFHSGREAALEENGLADFAEGAEEIVVLHVASAHP